MPTFKATSVLEREIRACPDCRLWLDGVGFKEGQEYFVHLVRSGVTHTYPSIGTVPIYSEYVLCDKHRNEWDSGPCI